MSTPNKEEPRLWEIDHQYYCAEGNCYSNDCSQEYVMWTDFLREFGDADMDYNLLFRWDWEPDGGDGGIKTTEQRRAYAEQFGMRDRAWTLKIFWMGQRKGLFFSSLVKVCKDDEPAVRKFLEPRAEHLRKIWEPLL